MELETPTRDQNIHVENSTPSEKSTPSENSTSSDLKWIRVLSPCDFNSILITSSDTPTNILYHTNAEKFLRVLEFFYSVNPDYLYSVEIDSTEGISEFSLKIN